MKVCLNLNPDGSVTWSSASDEPGTETPPAPTNPLPGTPTPTVPNPPPFPPPGPVLPPVPAAPPGVDIDPLPNVHSSISLDTPFDVNTQAVWVFSVLPNRTHAFRIVAVPGQFPPNGVQIETNQSPNGGNRVARTMCISDAPGSRVPITYNGGSRGGIEGANIPISINSMVPYGVVSIEPNREYWLNIWAMLPDTPMDYMITPKQM